MSRNYTLNVKDFGPTADASVDMRPLTVFVGPSNTGKSYLATLIYALHRCLRDPGELPELPDQAAPDPDVLTSAMLAQWAAATARSRADTAPGCLLIFPRKSMSSSSRSPGDVALLPEQVGVWLFRTGARDRGSTVAEIKLEDSRLFSSSFDEVAADTYNKWARIADLVEKGR